MAFFLLWAALAIISGSGRARFSQAANLLTEEKPDVLNHKIGYCQKSLPKVICRFFFNKPTLFAASYLENYAGHFSPQFLFFDGTFLRRNILPQSGLMLTGELVIFYLGIWHLFRKPKPGTTVFLLWLSVYPIANSFTGLGEISRVAFAAPLFSILCAVSLDFLFRKYRELFFLNSLILLGSAAIFLVNYFSIFPITNAYYTNHGYDQLFAQIANRQDRYDKIYISKGYAGSVSCISAFFPLPVNPALFEVPDKIDRYQDALGYYIPNFRSHRPGAI